MIRTNCSSASFLSLAFLLTGCSTTSSDNIKTSGFYARYDITQVGSEKPSATATFQVGGATGTYIDLSSGDTIKVNGVPLERTKTIVNSINYVATVSEHPSYPFTLQRADGAHTSSIQHPAPFQITDQGPLTTNYEGTVTLHWTNSGTVGKMRVTLAPQVASDGCGVQTIEGGAPDSGVYSFPASSLLPADKSKPTCAYTIELSREVRSDIGAPFQGGSLSSHHTELITLQVHP